MILTWIIIFFYFLFPVLLKSDFHYYTFQKIELFCADSLNHSWLVIITIALVPFTSSLILFFTTFKIIQYLKYQIRENCLSIYSHNTLRRNSKAIKLLIITASIFYVAWLPYTFTYLTNFIKNNQNFIPGVVKFSFFWLAFSNSFINNFVYMAIYTKFRKNILNLIYSFVNFQCFKSQVTPIEHITLSLKSNPTEFH